MQDFEPDEKSALHAKKLSAQLMKDFYVVLEDGPMFERKRKSFSESHYAESAEGVPIKDVVSNISQMANEFAMARYWNDGEIPCLRIDDEELVPISMTEYLGNVPSWITPGTEDWFYFWERNFGPPESQLLERNATTFCSGRRKSHDG